MSPFFTKTGDDGTTGLLGNQRVDKSDLRIEVLGSLDELSAAVGLARSLCETSINDDLKKIQVTIYEMMSEIAATGENVDKFKKINDETVDSLESLIGKYSAKTRVPSEFILPGDNPASAALSIARATARRAERRLVELGKRESTIRSVLFKYQNRLSSFLYIVEIYAVQSQLNSTLSLAKKKA